MVDQGNCWFSKLLMAVLWHNHNPFELIRKWPISFKYSLNSASTSGKNTHFQNGHTILVSMDSIWRVKKFYTSFTQNGVKLEELWLFKVVASLFTRHCCLTTTARRPLEGEGFGVSSRGRHTWSACAIDSNAGWLEKWKKKKEEKEGKKRRRRRKRKRKNENVGWPRKKRERERFFF